jgi:uncharacterized small protein (DUF1192 family)
MLNSAGVATTRKNGMIGEDDAPRRRSTHDIGQDLSMVSVEELHERVSLLKAEISRVEAEIKRKGASRAAADEVFKL